MRVKCQTVDDFVQNLVLVRPEDVLLKVIYVSRIFRPVGPVPLKDALKVAVVFQASAIINVGEDGQYLLEVGEDCGFDFKDSGGEHKGSIMAAELKKKIEVCCKCRELHTRPGMIDM